MRFVRCFQAFELTRCTLGWFFEFYPLPSWLWVKTALSFPLISGLVFSFSKVIGLFSLAALLNRPSKRPSPVAFSGSVSLRFGIVGLEAVIAKQERLRQHTAETRREGTVVALRVMFFLLPQWLNFKPFLWLVFLLKKTKPKKVNLFLVRKLRD